ncbi:hypothetical protein OPKNFCMD_3443 [Methylobacterium crusticola]|uniref:Glycosyltransferase 2-like domain-containing protein n=1 Tax=Methylobacterium crusticola TaxID=1697972 RepID=A0ABQ4QZF0_9HYPH|nr:glycosyltransferase [Methylobacterium crusticola]GJD50698.1 hypothetical protein OPKNFCMD_3443 [Methylobacterium crusticola]
MTRLGIGITTYDRVHRLAGTLDSVARHTATPHRLVVADDGSGDGTRDLLRARRVRHIPGPNRGIAWNKNRLLYYFTHVDPHDVIVLLEDDTFPHADGWERPWIEAARRYGHANFASPGLDALYTGGSGLPGDPYRSPVTSANCAAFGRAALLAVGFMDTRFRRYGYEHGEHTERLIRAGYGGDPATGDKFLVRSPLHVTEIGAAHYDKSLEANAQVYIQLKGDTSLFRPAWRSPEERRALQADLRAAVTADRGARAVIHARTTTLAMMLGTLRRRARPRGP